MKHFILILLFLIFPITAWAACTTPAGVEAQILYNNDHKIVQYCDGTSWIGLGNADLTTALANLTDTNVSPTDGQVLTWDNANSEWIASDTTSGWKVPDDAATCSGGGITGTIRYNSGKIQVCNNTAWVDVGGAESGGVWSLTGNDISNTNTGNVGVGEPSPTTKLHVAGKTTTDAIVLKRQIGIGAPTSTAGWNYSGGNLDFTGGNVGIGVGTPVAKLEVQSGSVSSYVFRALASDGSSLAHVWETGAGDGALYVNNANSNNKVVLSSNGNSYFMGGNVGIGTTNPNYPLHIVATGTTAAAFQFPATGGVVSLLRGGSYQWFQGIEADSDFYISRADTSDPNKTLLIKASDGNVGIGTTNPGYSLSVGTAVGGGDFYIGAMDSTNEGAQLFLEGAGSYDTWTPDVFQNNLRLWTNSTNSNQVQIFNNSTGLAGLYVEGNVGIGTVIPNARLDLGTLDGHAIKLVATGSGQNTYIGSGSTNALRFDWSSGQALESTANIQFSIDANNSDNDIRYIDFQKNGANFGNGTSLLRIDEDGDVGIGTTNPSYKLDVNGPVNVNRLYGGGTSNFHIDSKDPTRSIYLNWYSTGSVYARSTLLASSDERLKKDIVVIPDALSRLEKLRGVAFTWKDPQRPGKQIGVIAQEVEKVFPELVKEDTDGFLTVGYTGLIAPLIEAVKELKADNDDLRGIIEELGQEIESLKVSTQGR